MVMDNSLIWLIAGFALVIVELVTGTFYLLVLGVACLVGAGVSFTGSEFLWQALAAAVVAVVGVIAVQRYKKTMLPAKMQELDFGQAAAFDSWVNQAASQARVKYRDTLWDAHVAGDIAGEPGEILYISAVDGNALKVSKIRPA